MTFANFASVTGLLLVVFVLPILLGHLLAGALKVKQDAWRISLTLLALSVGLTPFVWPYVRNGINQSSYETALATWDAKVAKAEKEGKTPPTPESRPVPPAPEDWTTAIKLGIDLAGGTNLVYEVEPGALDNAVAENPDQSRTGLMERMTGAITRRVNPSGTEEVTVRQVGLDRIEIIMPGAATDEVDRMKAQIVNLGSLEFAILATENRADHRQLIAAARELPDNRREIRQGNELQAAWRDAAREQETGDYKVDGDHGGVVTRTVSVGGEDQKQYLVVYERADARVTGKYLTKAAREPDPETGGSLVSFRFNGDGAYWFRQLTSKYAPPGGGTPPYRLAVLLNNDIQSAPNLKAILSASGVIEGMNGPEVDELVNVLNAGALVVPLKKAPISEATIGPTLADDVREKGMWAIGIAASAVFVFMLVYYRFAGVVADICLLLNLVLVMGTMALIEATFTLPGLAGIVLTIGMAVDANVLIFERIREETAKGSRMKMAIQNGFDKAFSTIIDANVTTLITAVVLYMIGTDQIRGFAVTLIIGILMSMFTALYVGRMFFDIAERRGLRELKMLSIVGDTHWDFIGKQGIAFIVSIVAIVGGMAALTTRGEDNLDIDFSGGIMVTFEVDDPKGVELERVRKALDAEFGPGITLERLVTLEEEYLGDRAKRYRLRLKQSDVVDDAHQADVDDTAILTLVSDRIANAFDTAEIPLRIVKLGTIPQMQPIAAADPETVPTEEEQAFAGGNLVELTFSEPIKTATAQNYLVTELSEVAGGKYPRAESLIRLVGTKGPGTEVDPDSHDVRTYDGMALSVKPEVDPADLENALDNLQKTMAASPLFEEVNSFSSSVGNEMKWSAAKAMFVSLIAIIAYIWFRFEQVTFGLAAVAALVHDVLVVLGAVAIAAYLSGNPIGAGLLLYDFKINLPMIAAFLTIVGYSLNDTIVVFDRIREVRGKNPALTTEMVNTSLNQTLSRTLLTSVTTFIVVSILYAIGGEGIHGFAFCLVVGVVVGTYSSIYVASPVLLWLTNRDNAAARKSPAVTERKTAAAG